MKIKAALICGTIGVFICSALLFLITPSLFAQTPNTVQIIDKAVLIFNGEKFWDRNPYDGENEWRTTGECGSIIKVNDFGTSQSTANVTIRRGSSVTSQCASDPERKNLPMSGQSRSTILAYKLDADTIFFPVGFKDPGCALDQQPNAVDGNPIKANTFKHAPEGDVSYAENTYFQFKDGYNEKIKLTTNSPNSGNVHVDSGCQGGANFNGIRIGDTGLITDQVRGTYSISASNEPPGHSTSDAGQAKPSCESGGGDLSWILCPLLRYADKFVSYLDNQINSLLTVPNSYFEGTNGENLRNTWVRIRNLAYIILIPIMLVMVISTALGFEFISAYTVKKSFPRFAAAVLFIALSYDLIRFLIILTNDVGTGILGLLTSSFGGGSITLASLFDAGGANDAIFTTAAIGAAAGAVVLGSMGILISYAFVVGMALLVAFLALAFRQMFIIALLLLAPIAILAWIFPGNDKLWKTWWGTLSKLLLLFPLIMILVASGRVFAKLINEPEGSGLLETILKLTAYILPYFLIPATFKFAGGIFATVSGMANDKSRGLFDRNKKYRQKQMSQNWERRGERRIVAKRADWQNRLQSSNSRLARAGGKFVGGYNIQAAASAKQAAIGKELNDQIATGRDEEIRALTVNKLAAQKAGALTVDKDGHMSNGLMRKNKDSGLTEYKTLAGAWVNEGAVNAGQSRWGKDVYAQQTALSYEMRKAMTSEQVGDISSRYSDLATQQWGMNENQAAGAWIGAGFENQNQHIEFKNTSWKGQLDGKKLATEVYEKKGSYPLSQMSAHTIDQLGVAHANAVVSGDVETQNKIAAVAETFMARGGGGVAGMDADGNPVMAAGGGGVMTSTPGAASVAESVRKLAVQTGVYQAPDSTTDTKPSNWKIPPPNIPRQN